MRARKRGKLDCTKRPSNLTLESRAEVDEDSISKPASETCHSQQDDKAVQTNPPQRPSSSQSANETRKTASPTKKAKNLQVRRQSSVILFEQTVQGYSRYARSVLP